MSLYHKVLKSYLKRMSKGWEFLCQIKERHTMLAASMEKQQEQDGRSIVLEDMQMGCVTGASFLVCHFAMSVVVGVLVCW